MKKFTKGLFQKFNFLRQEDLELKETDYYTKAEMFINTRHSDEIEQNGYLVLDLFSLQEIQSLLEIAQSVAPDVGFSGLSYSLMQSDTDKKKTDSQKISTIIRSSLEREMENFQVFGESFIVKWAKKNEEFYLHQDWSYTDEQQFPDCYTLWIPLQDTTFDNGCVFVLPGSHRYFNNHRSATLSTVRIPVSGNLNLSKQITPVEMKTGQALLFKQSLFHGSYPNLSDINRWCAVAIIKRADIPLFYYQKTSETEVARYRINENMFVNELKHVSHGNTPTEYMEVQTIPYQHPLVTEKILMNKTAKKIPAIIKDESTNLFFEENGYAEISGITNKTLDNASLLFKQYFNDQTKSMFVSHQESSFETNIEVNTKLYALFKDWLDTVFMDYQFVIGHFISKSNINSTEFNLHQDWNIIDESVYPFIHLWIPLQDTTPENGGLKVLPRSHNILHNNRSGSLGIPFIEPDRELQPYIKNLTTPKGDCLLYAPALFHGSSPNKSPQPRIVVLLAITHKDAPLNYYHQNENGRVEVFRIKGKDLLHNLKELSAGKTVPSSNISTTINTNKIPNKEITNTYLKTLLLQR